MKVRYSLISDSRHRTDDDQYLTDPQPLTLGDPAFQNDASYGAQTSATNSSTYLLIPEDQQQFVVTLSGDVLLQKPLDYENQRSHVITIVNQTLDIPPRLDYMTIVVVVMDVNDNAPRFSSASYVTSLAEDSEVGATVLVLTASDEDGGNNGQVEFEFAPSVPPSTRATFKVSARTGTVTLAGPLDRETVGRYSFSVVATDRGVSPLSSTASVVVNVLDTNDSPPVFLQQGYFASISEDATEGDAVFYLSVSDADEMQAPLEFFLTKGDPDSHFLLHRQGQLSVSGPLDRETKDQYVLFITVSDGRFTANTTLTITILDVNDEGPVCEEAVYEWTLSEAEAARASVLQVRATDADLPPHNTLR